MDVGEVLFWFMTHELYRQHYQASAG